MYSILTLLSFIYFEIFLSFSFNFSQSLFALLVDLIQMCIFYAYNILIQYLILFNFSLNFSPDLSLKTPAIKDRFNLQWGLFLYYLFILTKCLCILKMFLNY